MTIMEQERDDNVKKFISKKRFLYIKLFATIFMIGFMIGIIVANAAGEKYLSQSGMLSDYFISKYKYIDFSSAGLFWFILKKRLKWIVLLWGFGLTIIGVPMVWGYTGWLGFSAGMILSVAVIRFGFLGTIICILGVFPQILIYAPVLVILMNQVYIMSLRQYHSTKGFHSSNESKKQVIGGYFILLVITVLLFIIGAFLEGYINPILLKKLLISF